MAELSALGVPVEILSGDRETAVRAARRDGSASPMSRRRARPPERSRVLAALGGEGRKVLMVGDGLNDAPALAAAHASMAPASAADIGRNAADLVFLRESLGAVPQAVDAARRADAAGAGRIRAGGRLQRARGAGRGPGTGRRR